MTIEELEQLWQVEISNYRSQLNGLDLDLSDVHISLHNASWCPDCVRETSELLAIKQALKEKAPHITLISYEDKEHYMNNKSSLEVNCVPTIIASRDGQEYARIEENSQGKLLERLS
ncbi:thioredoxin family protein [Pseudoteredinibacter isoporae]|uniref:Thiol-disulfide isomerase/thioredoxin n=1 Tax=Pseudoteredinibacter isoporae TaxID=570281 RepID=A0A7X0JX41_9GAMM|nr:thioredoxin family protein [Pseudoteredinibacter isoporae]MBB6523872.1 thiol-disulfide isomerase/thioredoxin [Pseudoteredinibacter isoporae]NHO89389.1 thioredoxin family protein [Pseudoteredinibacter isoporae]NIB22496.1 thioredoxin family protein [Pseudoteredinibacter isoporae]